MALELSEWLTRMTCAGDACLMYSHNHDSNSGPTGKKMSIVDPNSDRLGALLVTQSCADLHTYIALLVAIEIVLTLQI